MRQLGLIIAFSVAMLAGGVAASAGDGHVKCSKCDHVCEMTIDHSPKKKTCWRIEYKPICVPKVTFPWQKGCGCGKSGKGGKGCSGCNGCAKVKYVKVLVKDEYECPSCKCKFTPVPCGKDGKYIGAPVYESGDEANDVPADPPAVRNDFGTPVAPVSISDPLGRRRE